MFVEIDDFNEVFIIFEILNVRGKDLEIVDLLKNYLFKIVNKKVGEVKKNWK